MEVMVRQDECGALLSLTLLYTSIPIVARLPLSLALCPAFPISHVFFFL